MIFPKKNCISFLFIEKGIYVLFLTMSGSTLIPLLTIIWPKRLPSNTAKIIFLGFKDVPYLKHHLKILFKWHIWSDLFLEHCYIIEIHQYTPPNQFVESDVHSTLKCCTSTGYPKWHSSKCECTPLHSEHGFKSAKLYNKNIVVSRTTI